MKRALAGIVLIVSLLLVMELSATATDGPTMTQFRALQRQVNRIDSRVTYLNNCLAVIPVTQFGDYEQYFDTGPITGLDLDSPGFQDWNVLVWECAVAYGMNDAKIPSKPATHP